MKRAREKRSSRFSGNIEKFNENKSEIGLKGVQ